MENIVPLLYSTASANNAAQKSSDELKDFSGFNMKKILENIIEDLEEVSMEILVKPKPKDDSPKRNQCSVFSVEFQLKEEFPYFFLNACPEETSSDDISESQQVNKLLDRLEVLQESYSLLLEKASKTLGNLKIMYDPKEYNIFITKKTTKLASRQKTVEMDQKELQEGAKSGSTIENMKETHPIPPEGENKVGGDAQIAGKNLPPTSNNGQSGGKIPALLEDSLNKNETEQKKPVILAEILNKKETGLKNPLPLTEVPKPEKENVAVIPKKRKLSFLQPDAPKKQNTHEYPIVVEDLMIIGPNGTTIQQKHYEGLQLKGAPGATRFLCDVIFGDDVLATHSLTGNQSPAFRGRERPHKRQLDPLKTADITHLICSKFNVSQQLVRSTITTKCADATKKLKRILSKTM